MKKIFLILLITLGLVMIPGKVDAKGKVAIYVFRGYDCPHCEEALEYINKHKDKIPEGVEIITYEVWKNENNANLQEAVADELEVDKSTNYGVPFIVIGEQYIKGYSDSSTFDRMLSIAKNYVDSDDYKDVVKTVARNQNILGETKTLEQLFPEPNKVVTIVAYSIFGVLVLGFAGLIVFSRKK